jgi:hypothetical protein
VANRLDVAGAPLAAPGFIIFFEPPIPRSEAIRNVFNLARSRAVQDKIAATYMRRRKLGFEDLLA